MWIAKSTACARRLADACTLVCLRTTYTAFVHFDGCVRRELRNCCFRVALPFWVVITAKNWWHVGDAKTAVTHIDCDGVVGVIRFAVWHLTLCDDGATVHDVDTPAPSSWPTRLKSGSGSASRWKRCARATHTTQSSRCCVTLVLAL
jgi:hypothetical protein